MPWSLGIVVLKNSLLFLFGDQNGVFACERRRISSQLAGHLDEVFSMWGVKESEVENVYLAFTPFLGKLLPPDWEHRHLRLTPSPVEGNPFLPESLQTRVFCVNNIGEMSYKVIAECAGSDGVSIIASYSPLFPEKEEGIKRRILELNPDGRVFCSYRYPILNFYLREKCLIFQALSSGILERWHSELMGFFKNSKLRLWLVEDEALHWSGAEEIPQRLGLEAERVVYFLLARGSAICSRAEHALAVFYDAGGYYILEIRGEDVTPVGEEDAISFRRSIGHVKSMLRNISSGQKLTVFNYTGKELGFGYPFEERKAGFSVSVLGMGLFNSPKRVKISVLSLQRDPEKVKEELTTRLMVLNRSKQLFDKPQLSFKEFPLRYLPYSGLFVEAILSGSGRCEAG